MSLWMMLSNMKMDITSTNTSSNSTTVTKSTSGTTTAIPSSSSQKVTVSLPATTAASIRKRKPFNCVICMGRFRINIPHNTTQCEHSCCRECIRQYFQNTLKDPRYSNYEQIQCPQPGCEAHFNTEKTLYHFMTKSEIKHWWKKAIMKSYIHNKLECPHKGCRAIYDVEDDKMLKNCTFVECLECHRGLCVACQSPWHPGVIKKRDEEEEEKLVLDEAKKRDWTRCSRCQRFVEKISGCTTILCTCGSVFCYRCGGSSQDHRCLNNCQNYSAEKLKATRADMFNIKKLNAKW